MTSDNHFKPNRSSFVIFRFLERTFTIIILFTILTLIAVPLVKVSLFRNIILISTISISLFLILFNYISLSVQYKKEKYVFRNNKIFKKGGGIFSNYEVELVVKNITHVSMRLPYIQNKFFNTGNIRIESAGSGHSEIYLRHINHCERVYNHIQDLMKHNGFRLKKANLIRKEIPSTIGVCFETFRPLLLIMIFSLIFGIAILITLIASHSLITLIAVSSAMSIGALLIILFFLFRFLDLKYRLYEVYDDTITYKEGFLSKNYSFIPFENLSDSTLTQNLFDRIFGISDVRISCQGTGQEIHFKNMLHGSELVKDLDSMIAKTNSLIKTASTKVIGHERVKQKTVNLETSFTGEFEMMMTRSIFPFVFLIPLIITIVFIPILIIYFVTVLISVSTNKYYIKPKSIRHKFDFIHKKDIEFRNDKIVAVVIKENFMDKWFNTCSILFWSIGSSEQIKFTNIKKSEVLYDNILAKIGIRPQQILYNMNSEYTLGTMLKKVFFLTFLGIIAFISLIALTIIVSVYFVIAVILLLLLLILLIMYQIAFYNRSRSVLYEDYIYFTKGIFFKEFYYVRYDHIKDITTLKYPFTNKGSITFNIAGERIIQTGNKGQKRRVNNHFTIKYVNNIKVKDELIDLIFYKRPKHNQISEIEKQIELHSEVPILSTHSDLSNSLSLLLAFSIIVFPFIILLPLTIPLVVLTVNARAYFIQSYRVVYKSGIIYKKQTSIVFHKIDHLNTNQDFFNKMFKNGNVSINTTSSTTSELVVRNVSNYLDFYHKLNEFY